MARFTVRVVLHNNATWDDYNLLHVELGKRNLIDVITGDNGVIYRLPPAEYYGEGPVTAARCREIAAEAAQLIGKRYSIFVTEGEIRSWQGLDRA